MMTTTQFNKIFKQLDMSRAALAEALDVAPRSISNWLNGVHPVNQAHVPVLKELLTQRANEKSEPKEEVIEAVLEEDVGEEGKLPVEEEKEEEIPIWTLPKGIRRLIKRLKINQREFSELIPTTEATVSTWVRGKNTPREKYHARLKELWENAFAGIKVQTTVVPKKKAPGTGLALRRPLKAAPLLEMSTEFYEQYRAERNRRDADAILTFMSEKLSIDPAALRQAVAIILLTLKKEMDVEEMYRCLTGHRPKIEE